MSHFSAELELFHEKIAATRQVKEIKKRLDAGDLQGARNLAQKLLDGGVLKVTDLGSQLRQLGAGREGVAFLVVGAKDAPAEAAVRKMYDPSAYMYNPANPDLKVRLGEQLNNNDGFAKMYTKRRARMAGNIPYHVGEYIPGHDIGSPQITPTQRNRYVDELENTIQAANKQVKLNIGDVVERDFLGKKFNPGNARVTPDGKVKIIDYLPRNEFGGPAEGSYVNAEKAQPHFEAIDAANRKALFARDAAERKKWTDEAERIDAEHLRGKPKNVFRGMQQATSKGKPTPINRLKDFFISYKKPLLGAAALTALGAGGLAYASSRSKPNSETQDS